MVIETRALDNDHFTIITWQQSFRSCHQKRSSKKKFSFSFLLSIRDCLKWLRLVFTKLLYASIIAEQYPKLVNGPPPERRRVDKDKKQICDKHERARGRESSRKKGITNNGLRKQFQTSHIIFFFHSPNATIKIFVWEFLANRRMKSLKRKKVRKSQPLFCLQQRCLLASIDQKPKTRGLTIV